MTARPAVFDLSPTTQTGAPSRPLGPKTCNYLSDNENGQKESFDDPKLIVRLTFISGSDKLDPQLINHRASMDSSS